MTNVLSGSDNMLTLRRMIQEERNRQTAKFGIQSHSPEVWYAILGEEVGEVAEALLSERFNQNANPNLVPEIVQVAAVCVAWLEQLSREGRLRG